MANIVATEASINDKPMGVDEAVSKVLECFDECCIAEGTAALAVIRATLERQAATIELAAEAFTQIEYILRRTNELVETDATGRGQQ